MEKKMKNFFVHEKKVWSVLILCCFFACSILAEDSLVVRIDNENATAGPMRLYVGVVALVATAQQEVEALLEDFKQVFSFERQFEVTAEVRARLPRKRLEIKALFDRGFDAAVFVTFSGNKKAIEWRLYDTDSVNMVCGRKIFQPQFDKVASQVAVRVFNELMGQSPPLLSSVTFVERKKSEGGSVVWIARYDGKTPVSIYDSQRILVSPSWGTSKKGPFLALSEFTPHNVRFIGLDLEGKRYILLDKEGTNVGIFYSDQCRDAVYCSSGHIWRFSFNRERQLWEHRNIKQILGTCGSPSIANNGDIVYCSNGKICSYSLQTGKQSIYTPEGYHVAPSYSPVQDAVLFSSRIAGEMQIQRLDLKTRKIQTMTTGSGCKTDPCWSPCGRYCAYCLQRGAVSTIMVRNLTSGQEWSISPKGIYAQFPAWSPSLVLTED